MIGFMKQACCFIRFVKFFSTSSSSVHTVNFKLSLFPLLIRFVSRPEATAVKRPICAQQARLLVVHHQSKVSLRGARIGKVLPTGEWQTRCIFCGDLGLRCTFILLTRARKIHTRTLCNSSHDAAAAPFFPSSKQTQF